MHCQKNDANIRALAGGGGRIIEGMQVRTSGGTVGRRRPLPHLSWWILPANDSKGRHEKADHRQRSALFRLTLFMYMSDRLSASEANGPPGRKSRAWTAEITMCLLLKEIYINIYKKISSNACASFGGFVPPHSGGAILSGCFRTLRLRLKPATLVLKLNAMTIVLINYGSKSIRYWASALKPPCWLKP